MDAADLRAEISQALRGESESSSEEEDLSASSSSSSSSSSSASSSSESDSSSDSESEEAQPDVIEDLARDYEGAQERLEQMLASTHGNGDVAAESKPPKNVKNERNKKQKKEVVPDTVECDPKWANIVRTARRKNTNTVLLMGHVFASVSALPTTTRIEHGGDDDVDAMVPIEIATAGRRSTELVVRGFGKFAPALAESSVLCLPACCYRRALKSFSQTKLGAEAMASSSNPTVAAVPVAETEIVASSEAAAAAVASENEVGTATTEAPAESSAVAPVEDTQPVSLRVFPEEVDASTAVPASGDGEVLVVAEGAGSDEPDTVPALDNTSGATTPPESSFICVEGAGDDDHDEEMQLLGIIEEVFGPVENPFYSVSVVRERPASGDAGPEEDVRARARFFVPVGSPIYELRPVSSYVLPGALYSKGSDASNQNDEEIEDKDRDFSDDEEEAAFKREQKRLRRENRSQFADADNSGESGPNPRKLPKTSAKVDRERSAVPSGGSRGRAKVPTLAAPRPALYTATGHPARFPVVSTMPATPQQQQQMGFPSHPQQAGSHTAQQSYFPYPVHHQPVMGHHPHQMGHGTFPHQQQFGARVPYPPQMVSQGSAPHPKQMSQQSTHDQKMVSSTEYEEFLAFKRAKDSATSQVPFRSVVGGPPMQPQYPNYSYPTGTGAVSHQYSGNPQQGFPPGYGVHHQPIPHPYAAMQQHQQHQHAAYPYRQAPANPQLGGATPLPMPPSVGRGVPFPARRG